MKASLQGLNKLLSREGVAESISAQFADWRQEVSAHAWNSVSMVLAERMRACGLMCVCARLACVEPAQC